MSHGIIEGMDKILRTGNVPCWHGLDEKIEDGNITKEMLTRAGLSDLLVLPTFYRMPDGAEIETGKAHIVREDDGRVLSDKVTPKWVPIQPMDMVNIAKSAMDLAELSASTLGSTGGGRRMFICANLPQTTMAGSTVYPYIVVQTMNDGTGACYASLTGTRAECDNTLGFILSEARGNLKAQANDETLDLKSLRIIHAGNMDAKIAKLSAALRGAKYRVEMMRRNAEALAAKKLQKEQSRWLVDQLMTSVYPDPRRTPESTEETLRLALERAQEKRAYAADRIRTYAVRELKEAGAMLYNEMNAWLMWNVIGEWSQRDYVEGMNNEDRCDAIIDGKANRVSVTAYNMLQAM